MNVVIGLTMIATYIYLWKKKGANKMPWWVHISLLLATSSLLVKSVLGSGLVSIVNSALGFLAGFVSGLLEVVAKQPITIGTSVFAAGVGVVMLIILIADVRDKEANKPALVAAVLIPLLATSATGLIGSQGQEMTSQVAEVAENAGRSILGG